MKTHSSIVSGSETARKLSEMLGVSVHTVRSWAQRNSIPPEHWATLASNEVASLDELAAAAANRRPAQEASAA